MNKAWIAVILIILALVIWLVVWKMSKPKPAGGSTSVPQAPTGQPGGPQTAPAQQMPQQPGSVM